MQVGNIEETHYSDLLKTFQKENHAPSVDRRLATCGASGSNKSTHW